MKQSILLLAMAACTFTACTKSNDEVVNVTLKKENLAGTYVVGSIVLSTYGAADQNVTNEVLAEECQRDDTYNLAADGSLTFSDEGMQCSNTRIPTTGTWDLEAGSKLTIDGEVFTVQNFDGKTLVTSDAVAYNGINGTMVRTYYKR